MKKYCITTCLLFIVTTLLSQSVVTDSGSFLLHKFAQNIGKETYRITTTAAGNTYDINFKFIDRGSPVPLQAQLVTTGNFEPVSLFIKGNTSRFSQINDTIRITKTLTSIKVSDSVYSKTTRPLTFPVAGYSPGTVQMLLLQYWKTHGQQATIAMLPTGAVAISKQGLDTMQYNGFALPLERYILSGLVWGNEIMWTDKANKLICLITNDAEGDKLEMMNEAYENLLPDFLNKAAVYGMQLFSESMKTDVATGKPLCIVGGKIVDVATGNYTEHSTITIDNGLIKDIRPSNEVKIPAGATVIHADGKTIVPGLWDMHAHFEQAEWGPAYLAAGVTTVRDCGNEFGYINAIKQAIDVHKGIGPFIIKAGIIDGPGPMGLGIVRASTKAEAIEAVDMYKNNGFDQIKIYSSVQPAIVKAIADEAHRLGLTVTGHIPQGMTTVAGIDSGMDQVNHMQYISAMMKKDKDKLINFNDSANIAALNFLKDHHTIVDPTMGVFEMVLRSVDDDILLMEPNYHSLPIPLQALFVNMGMPAAQAITYKPMFQSMLHLVKALHDKGIPIVAGTDMGFPGYSVARELELYVMAGLTPLQAIQSATIVPAQVMHRDKIAGSITIGKQADLLILDADPLTEIRNIRKVLTVIKAGEQYDPHVLHRMVGFGE
jgi:imidazolonepropionase-like amidohydrolase